MTEGRSVCHSEECSDEESQAIARILRIHPDNETHSLHIELENPKWINLSAEW